MPASSDDVWVTGLACPQDRELSHLGRAQSRAATCLHQTKDLCWAADLNASSRLCGVDSQTYQTERRHRGRFRMCCRDYISHLVWEYCCFPTEELEELEELAVDK